MIAKEHHISDAVVMHDTLMRFMALVTMYPSRALVLVRDEIAENQPGITPDEKAFIEAAIAFLDANIESDTNIELTREETK